MTDCPVLLQSKLQSETAFSTMEMEHWLIVAGSFSPVINMVISCSDAVGLSKDLTIMHLSICEDNAGA